jgi:hypothetical protein
MFNISIAFLTVSIGRHSRDVKASDLTPQISISKISYIIALISAINII